MNSSHEFFFSDPQPGDRVRIRSDYIGPFDEVIAGQFGTVDRVESQRIEVSIDNQSDAIGYFARKDYIFVPYIMCNGCERLRYRQEMADYLCRDCR